MSHCDEETLSFNGNPFGNMSPSPESLSEKVFTYYLISAATLNVLSEDVAKRPESQHHELSSWHRVWAMIKVEVKLVMSDVRLPVARSLCLHWCRSDTVCRFGTKITHAHTSVHATAISIGYWVFAKQCQTQLFVNGPGRQTHPDPCASAVLRSRQFWEAVKANCLRWTTWEASSVDSIRPRGACYLPGFLYECM